MQDKTARIVLATDEPVTAEGLASFLRSQASFEFTSIPLNGGDLVAAALSHEPDLLLIDLISEVPGKSILEIWTRIPSCPIVLWSHDITRELANQAIELKISGILRKTASRDAVLRCLNHVLAGELWYERRITDGLQRAKRVTLTNREIQLLQLVSQGLSNKEISSLMFISEGSVKVYLSRLFRKTEVKDRFELGLYGLRQFSTGLLPQEGMSRRQAASARDTTSLWARSIVL